MGLSIIILAAGNGSRMHSDIPKVLHTVGGVSMLERVVNTAYSLEPDSVHVVYGVGGDQLRDACSHLSVNWVEQKKQLGTGHAVLQALPFVDADDQIIVLYGDVPLISTRTLKKLIDETPPNGIGIVVAEFEDPRGFGRIIRNDLGNILAIVEHKDANEKQRHIKEINTGILTGSAKDFNAWLPALKNKNAQGEYYLTDVVDMAVQTGHPVGGVMAHCHEEVRGVNDRWQLASLETHYRGMCAKALTMQGVTVVDPQRIDCRAADLHMSHDVTLDVNVILEGKVKIGKNTVIGANVHLKDAEIGNDVVILPNSIVDGAKLGNKVTVGPFARIRPGTVVEETAKVGNFVEIKNSRIKVGAKVSHLSYLGDASVGKFANIGAGTITCNYDGKDKHETHIGENAFIGSNASLVAPVKIQKNATVAAGSTITENVPAGALAFGRAKQVNKKDK